MCVCVAVQEEPRPAGQPAAEPGLQSLPPSSSPVSLLPAFSCAPAAAPAGSPEPELKAADENGDAEMEPMRNGAGHVSETESSDSGANPGDKDNSAGASQDMEGLGAARPPQMAFSPVALFVTCLCLVQTWWSPAGGASMTGTFS